MKQKRRMKMKMLTQTIYQAILFFDELKAQQRAHIYRCLQRFMCGIH